MARVPHPLVTELTRIRHDMGLTQVTASELTGVHRKTLIGWESGRAWPNLRELTVYAEGLGYRLTLTPKETR